ncbi:hypothetical protein FF098_015025 [Parvularcula flava]|uniref:RNA-binding protein AU-1/Ribonuclease E/G domain-containing protein n=1 Tax=Aquisalinus luteolus TaxID=1566827 RepID=A0A8J3A9T4_9PROT|nr:ribonuclease E/G [Aquisalinus luteolus]NHK29230.1 hypothetical protein [Aquisalinus luteolus]GGH99895.1 hypothetical protein GCM10011355_26910 [Aquisalinus luteolus]
MSARVLIDYGPVETRAALQEDDVITGLWIGPGFAMPRPAMAGERFTARVEAIDKKLGAAFVDLGDEQGFLPLPGKQALQEGQELVVEVRTPARGGKLASVRLSPDQKEPEARQSLLSHSMTQLGGEGAEEILLHAPVDKFIEAKSSLGGSIAHAGPDLFEGAGAEEAFEQALSRVVDLPGGARLAFDEAEAVTAIDMDISATGGQSKAGAVAKACRAAIPAIARQISLRGIGGQVVIDFPVTRRDGKAIHAALQEAAKTKGWRCHPLSDAGLVALTVARQGWSLLDYVTEPAANAPVPGREWTLDHLAAKALRLTERSLDADRAARLELLLPPAVHAHIEAHKGWVQPLYDTYGNRLTLIEDAGRERDRADVR